MGAGSAEVGSGAGAVGAALPLSRKPLERSNQFVHNFLQIIDEGERVFLNAKSCRMRITVMRGSESLVIFIIIIIMVG
jgi:hypothetical protein